MRILIRVLVLVPWLILLYFVGASPLVIALGKLSIPAEPFGSTTALFSMVSFLSAAMGGACYFLRQYFFAKKASLSVDTWGGGSVYLLLSLSLLFLGYVALAGLVSLFFLEGNRIAGFIGVLIGAAFLVLGFPLLPPKVEPSPESAPETAP